MDGFKLVAALCGLSVSLGGCGAAEDIGTLFGVSGGEQEQTALRNPPLTIPPNYDLRPPAGGAARSRQTRTALRARQSLLGAPAAAAKTGGPSLGEIALLRQAGLRSGIDSGVRREVDRETKTLVDGERTFVDKLLKWRETGTAAPARAGDKKGSNGESGRPVRDRNRPVIRRKGEIF